MIMETGFKLSLWNGENNVNEILAGLLFALLTVIFGGIEYYVWMNATRERSYFLYAVAALVYIVLSFTVTVSVMFFTGLLVIQ